MASLWLRAAALRVTTTYAVALVAVAAWLRTLGPHARDDVMSRMSTNVHNLSSGHLGTLIGSAFVSDSDDIFVWLPALVCLLALGELIWRSWGLLITFAVGHIGATLIVAAGLAAEVEARWLPISVARATDVGVSYGAVCVLGALTASLPSRWRPAWIVGWLGTTVTAAVGADFTAIGHILALLLGIGLSFRLRSMARWTPMRVILLIVSVAFGCFVVSGPSVLPLVVGLVGVLIALLVGRAWQSNSGTAAGHLPSKQWPRRRMSLRRLGSVPLP